MCEFGGDCEVARARARSATLRVYSAALRTRLRVRRCARVRGAWWVFIHVTLCSGVVHCKVEEEVCEEGALRGGRAVVELVGV